MKKENWILGILYSALIYCEAASGYPDYSPAHCIMLFGSYMFYTEDRTTPCPVNWSPGSWKNDYTCCCNDENQKSVNDCQNITRTDCFRFFVNSVHESSFIWCNKYGIRYPTKYHWMCGEIDPKRYLSEQAYKDAKDARLVDCSTLSSVTDWIYNASDFIAYAKNNTEATSTPGAVTDLKSNGPDATSAAETDLKSRGDQNPRPAIYGIVAATALCVLLQHI